MIDQSLNKDKNNCIYIQQIYNHGSKYINIYMNIKQKILKYQIYQQIT